MTRFLSCRTVARRRRQKQTYSNKLLQLICCFYTNESDNKLILLERRFDVIFTSFSSSIKVRYHLIVHMTVDSGYIDVQLGILRL